MNVLSIFWTIYMLVGTYTSGASTGIYVYRLDEATGKTEFVSEAKAVNPSYLAVSTDGRHVYSVGENEQKDAAVYAFTFDKTAGRLHLLNTVPTDGAGPCYIATDKAGRFAVTANYTHGSVSIFPLAADGSLLPLTKLYTFDGKSIVRGRQDHPHLHSTVFTPDMNYLFAADLGTDHLYKYAITDTAPFLMPATPFAFPIKPGSGPRHFTFHPNGRFAYLINELSGEVTAFHYADGNLASHQYIAADTSQGIGDKGSADIHISPDGKFLYASNRVSSDNIAIFRIDATDGRLTLVGHQPTESHPRNFIITPNGRYLLAASMNGHCIQVFKIDRETGLLHEDISKRINGIDRPVCLKFIHR